MYSQEREVFKLIFQSDTVSYASKIPLFYILLIILDHLCVFRLLTVFFIKKVTYCSLKVTVQHLVLSCVLSFMLKA